MEKTDQFIKILDELLMSAENAYKNGYFLQSAIIIFQVVELFFRSYVINLMEEKKFANPIKKRVEDERYLSRLIFYSDLIEPKNTISIGLKNLNERRNGIMHRLLEFESAESLNEELRDFYNEGKKLTAMSYKLAFPNPVSARERGGETE